MQGKKFVSTRDKWYWKSNNKRFREQLIESSSNCKNKNGFVGIPCKVWTNFSESILSFSKCGSAKFMTYSTLFINNNYPYFTKWVHSFINSNISWAFKFFEIPNHIVEIWDNYSPFLLSKLSNEAQKKELIFFVSAGPATNVIITYLVKINNKNIYIDLGSAIEFITKGYSTRSYSNNNSFNAAQSCEQFIIKDKKLIYKA